MNKRVVLIKIEVTFDEATAKSKDLLDDLYDDLVNAIHRGNLLTPTGNEVVEDFDIDVDWKED